MSTHKNSQNSQNSPKVKSTPKKSKKATNERITKEVMDSLISEIGNVTDKNPIQRMQRIKGNKIRPTGNKRPHVVVEKVGDASRAQSLKQVDLESQTPKIMSDHEFQEALKIAKKNSVTKQLIEEAKDFTESRKDEIQKQFNDLVAFYNINQNKAFFFISSAEARLAIDHIKRCRQGYKEELEDKAKQDRIVESFMSEVKTRTISDSSHKDVVTELDIIDGLISKTIGITLDVYDSHKDIMEIKDKDGENDLGIKNAINWFPQFDMSNEHPYFGASPLYIGWLNNCMWRLEGQNMIVDVFIMNARNIATIRSWGQTVYDEYSKKERIERGVFGSLFGSEIYICNDLEDNQIILGTLNGGFTPSDPIFLNALLPEND